MSGDSNMQINSSLVEHVMVPAKEIGRKMKSKREVYRFLSSEVKAYLGEYDTMTIWHLRDIEAGDRTLIMSSDVKHISVPN